MAKKFSEEIKELIIDMKKIAERYGNNYIGAEHFLLNFNKYNKNEKLKLKISISELKLCIKSIRGKRVDSIDNNSICLTKQMEFALKTSSFHCIILKEKYIKPEHILLGISSFDMSYKVEYLRILNLNNIILSRLDKILVYFHFNNFWRKTGILKLLYQK
ncbi:MAG: Clp protease N-terminal domain-containing protein [Bacteroidia bacterium]